VYIYIYIYIYTYIYTYVYTYIHIYIGGYVPYSSLSGSESLPISKFTDTNYNDGDNRNENFDQNIYLNRNRGEGKYS
jgi:hypothetical protein